MLLTLQATPEQIARAKAIYAEDHAAFYAQPHGYRTSQSLEAHVLFNAPMGTLHHGYNELNNGLSGWVTSGGNAVMLNQAAGTVTYSGTRHGISPLWVLEKPSTHKVLQYETSMPFLTPFETLDRFAYRARLDSDCPIARGLALLNDGKSSAFLYAEFKGSDVATILKVYAECVKRGYMPL